MRFALGFSIVGLALSPLLASEPGHPLDCSDWVISVAGFSCTPWLAYSCESQGEFCQLSADLVADNAGNLVATRRVYVGDDTCGAIYRTEVVRHNGVSEQVIAHIVDRCHAATPNAADRIRPRSWQSTTDFDPANGRLLASLYVECDGCSNYVPGNWVAAFSGFASFAEVLHSFEPVSGDGGLEGRDGAAALGFHVPLRPEGFPAADWFDTYYGDLTSVGDWSQAQPLRCRYPVASPGVGDYLTVSDSLPDPAPGTGRYYLTAATYAGQTRLGRKVRGGVPSGRDPASLPECVEPARER